MLFLILSVGSNASENTGIKSLHQAENLNNVSYGNNPLQKMDIFLPERRDEHTKVIILLHGGSWISGDKSDLSYMIPGLQTQFPNHAIVNINYRLATPQSPAFPKQIDDIEQALQHLQQGNYHISEEYAFIGFSAGAHLAMLYSYAYDKNARVKAVCDVVGPADFTDLAYTSHPLFSYAAMTLAGTVKPAPAMMTELSPVSHINPKSPPTIMFYGGKDMLIPVSQGAKLKKSLEANGVVNEYHFYPDGGHSDWNTVSMQEVFGKIYVFLQQHL